jgi:hypothetical protein
LKVSFVTSETILEEKECAICQEEMEVGSEIVFMPDCRHCFHDECVKRWFTLVSNLCTIFEITALILLHRLLSQQSWCPVCRTQIVSTATASAIGDDDECGMVAEKMNLASRFHECGGDCEEEGYGDRGGGGWEDEDEELDEEEEGISAVDEDSKDASARHMVANDAVERALHDAVVSRSLLDCDSGAS